MQGTGLPIQAADTEIRRKSLTMSVVVKWTPEVAAWRLAGL